MNRPLAVLIFSIFALVAALSGCKSPNLEPGGPYVSTNGIGQVVSKDTALFLADSSYKLAYDSIGTVFKFEKENRAELWRISPKIKQSLDSARREVAFIELRWANARQLYRSNPTPSNLDGVQRVLAELQNIVTVVQAQLVTTK